MITIPNCTNLVSLKSRHHKLYNDTENTKNGGREGCQSSAQSWYIENDKTVNTLKARKRGSLHATGMAQMGLAPLSLN